MVQACRIFASVLGQVAVGRLDFRAQGRPPAAKPRWVVFEPPFCSFAITLFCNMECNCFPSYSFRDKLWGIFSKLFPLSSPFVYPLGRFCVCGCIGHGVAVSVGLDVRGALVIGLVIGLAVAPGVVAGNGEALAGYGEALAGSMRLGCGFRHGWGRRWNLLWVFLFPGRLLGRFSDSRLKRRRPRAKMLGWFGNLLWIASSGLEAPYGAGLSFTVVWALAFCLAAGDLSWWAVFRRGRSFCGEEVEAFVLPITIRLLIGGKDRCWCLGKQRSASAGWYV